MKIISASSFSVIFFSVVLLFSCKNAEQAPLPSIADEAGTPVTVATVSTGALEEFVELNATSSFLQKSYVKATTNGYIKSVSVQFGNPVSSGQRMFTLQTKEAASLGNAINKIDSSFRFTGLINIKANANGYVTQLDHQGGDYVQDGEQLAVITNRNSFVFLLELPYELKRYVSNNNALEITLPDGEKLNGVVSSAMPRVDSASQTQSIVIKVNARHSIPENLIAKVKVVKRARSNAASLPRSAVLTDEMQTSFWVMKLTDTVTAVRVPVIKGIETNDLVEIISPIFSANDKILISGNYGLSDTAKIKVAKN